MKKQKLKTPVLYRGVFTDPFKVVSDLTDKFLNSNLDTDLRQGISSGWLFVMPEGAQFAYCRGTGPISFREIRLGSHEKEVNGVPDFSSPRSLSVRYSVRLDCDNDDQDVDRQVSVYLSVPSRFTSYVERSKGIEHAPHLTKIEFVYKAADLRVWMREVQMRIYADAEHDCHARIDALKKRIDTIRQLQRGEIKPPSQSAFG